MQIRFEFQTKYGVYRDALNLDDNHTFTDDELNSMKQSRVDKWIYNIENPVVSDVTPVAEEIPVEEAPAE
jgi:hypothetical protein